MGGAVYLFAWNEDKNDPSLLVQKIVYAPVKKVQTTPPTGKTMAKLPSKPFPPAQQFDLAASIEEAEVAIKEFDTMTKLVSFLFTALLEAYEIDQKEARVNAMRSAIFELFPETKNPKDDAHCFLKPSENRMASSAAAAYMAPLLLRGYA
ncbi:hypothetical protein M8C21_010971 [Ambrosia artemisiifolia]|uniref:Uncharacterized protein n=1 Tax=Ambrosia artemisiifolia TaxID=4212 RepID=A0AAD5BNQ1_AMBAR|nr:hypothetical protein M8C21_010971 [Ambrosia artemisiifolia]